MSDPYPLVVRDIIMQALAHSPELLTADMGGNRRAAPTADIAERIASESQPTASCLPMRG